MTTQSRPELWAHETLDASQLCDTYDGGPIAYLHDKWLTLEASALTEASEHLRKSRGKQQLIQPLQWSDSIVQPWCDAVTSVWSELNILTQTMILSLAKRFEAPATRSSPSEDHLCDDDADLSSSDADDDDN